MVGEIFEAIIDELTGLLDTASMENIHLPIEAFTGQINTRVRGRQLTMKIESTAIGVQWQLGAPRLDIRPDGRR